MPQMRQVLCECAIGLLAAGTSTISVAIVMYVSLSTISRLQCRLKAFGSASNRPHKGKPTNAISVYFTCGAAKDQTHRQLMRQWVCTIKEIHHRNWHE